MAVNAVQNTSTATQATQSSRTVSDAGLGKDSFLQLLITQMRYQDPLEPASDTEYLSQLAQFNSLEQMQNLNDKFDKMLKWSQMTQASSLIGKSVDGNVPTGIDKDGNGTIDTSKVSGIVTEVRYVDGEPKVVVDDVEVKLSDILKIYQDEDELPAALKALDTQESQASNEQTVQDSEAQSKDQSPAQDSSSSNSTSNSLDVSA